VCQSIRHPPEGGAALEGLPLWARRLVLKNQQRRPQQIVVGILRHPPLELDAAAALEEQPVPIRGERVQIGAPSTVAAAMGQDEAAELRSRRRPSGRLVYGPFPSRVDHHPATASAMTITTSSAHRARSAQPKRVLVLDPLTPSRPGGGTGGRPFSSTQMGETIAPA
jgi:hypothetical protein